MTSDADRLIQRKVVSVVPGPRGARGPAGEPGSIRKLFLLLVVFAVGFLAMTAMTAASLVVQFQTSREFETTNQHNCMVRRQQVDAVIERDLALRASDTKLLGTVANPASRPIVEMRIATYDKEIAQLRVLRQNCG